MKTILPLLLGLVLAGCTTATVPAAPDPFTRLQKNLTAVEVKALVGEPVEIKPFPAEGLAAEVWVYHRVVSERDQPVPIGSREVPLTNPLNGQTSMTSEPVYEMQTIKVTETIELLMVEQRLIEWKRRQLADSSINFR